MTQFGGLSDRSATFLRLLVAGGYGFGLFRRPFRQNRPRSSAIHPRADAGSDAPVHQGDEYGVVGVESGEEVGCGGFYRPSLGFSVV